MLQVDKNGVLHQQTYGLLGQQIWGSMWQQTHRLCVMNRIKQRAASLPLKGIAYVTIY